MSHIQDAQGFIDTIKERISNPAIFTFICVWTVYNWQTLGWFLMEPLKFSLKLEMYLNSKYLFVFKEPLIWTAGVIIVSPFLNNSVDFIVRLSDRLYKLLLQCLGWKELIEVQKYNEAIDKIDFYKKEQFEVTSRFDSLHKEKANLEQELRDSVAKVNSLESDVKSKRVEIAKLNNSTKDLENSLSSLEEAKSQTEKELDTSESNLRRLTKDLKQTTQSYEDDLEISNWLNKILRNNGLHLMSTKISIEEVIEGLDLFNVKHHSRLYKSLNVVNLKLFKVQEILLSSLESKHIVEVSRNSNYLRIFIRNDAFIRFLADLLNIEKINIPNEIAIPNLNNINSDGYEGLAAYDFDKEYFETQERLNS